MMTYSLQDYYSQDDEKDFDDYYSADDYERREYNRNGWNEEHHTRQRY
jgi:hypothetical protein